MPQVTNMNLCAYCLAEYRPAHEYADTGKCGRCGRVADVYDLELIELYRGAQIPKQDVWSHLPRLRHSFLDGLPSGGPAEVGAALKKYFGQRGSAA